MTTKIMSCVRRSRALRLLLLCAAGIILNLAGGALAGALGGRYYFDTAGTMLAAALGGYLPGVIVGLVNNLTRSVGDSSQLYFGSVNMLVAVITAALSHKGVFRKFPRALLAVPVLVCTAGVLGSVIYWFISNSDSSGITSTVGNYLVTAIASEPFGEQLRYDLSTELADKGLMVALVYLLLRFMPERAKQLFADTDPYYDRVGESRAE